MIKISRMSREPSDSHKIQAQSVPETKDAFDAVAKQIARTVAFRGRKLRGGPLLNAIVIHFLGLTEAERENIAVEGLAIYEALLEHDDPQDDLLRSLLAQNRTRQTEASNSSKPVVGKPVGRIGKVKADRKRADKAD